MKNNKKIKAFTLAEVLITLTIIGVIAALTIPNLIQKYEEQATVKKVQKFYSTLNNAYSIAIKENGYVDEWIEEGQTQESSTKLYEILIKPYFKIVKDCGFDNNGNCWPNLNYKILSGQDDINYATKNFVYKIALNDGSILAISTYKNALQGNLRVIICYDSNGPKGPNTTGKDVFHFFGYPNKILPVGISPDSSYFTYPFDSTCNFNSHGQGCTAWVVYKGNMDYLHCNDLSWSGKQKCSK